MYDELVKKIRHCATDPMHCLSCGEVKDGRCFKHLMTQAADAIEELQADKAALNGTVSNLFEQIKDLGKPRWIPVTERLPKKDQKALIYWREAGEPAIDTAFWQGEWAAMHWVNMGDKVTHWMPLPEPPKEE